MNISNLGKVGIVTASVATIGALTACGSRNEDKTSEGVADDYVGRYDRDGDNVLDKTAEHTRDLPREMCVIYHDGNGDGLALECMVKQHYVSQYSVEALMDAADSRGDQDGKATSDELAAVVREFDVGSQDGKAIAGNNILERPEIKAFEESYGAQHVRDIF